jgi:hypothetical protein
MILWSIYGPALLGGHEVNRFPNWRPYSMEATVKPPFQVSNVPLGACNLSHKNGPGIVAFRLAMSGLERAAEKQSLLGLRPAVPTHSSHRA